MCCAELLTWQWDSEVSRRFQTPAACETTERCHFGMRAASHLWDLIVRPVTELFEIDCQQVWRELVNYTEGDLPPEMRDRITRHLQSCPHCRAVYDGSRNIVRLLGDKNVFELPQGFSGRLYRRFMSRVR